MIRGRDGHSSRSSRPCGGRSETTEERRVTRLRKTNPSPWPPSCRRCSWPPGRGPGRAARRRPPGLPSKGTCPGLRDPGDRRQGGQGRLPEGSKTVLLFFLSGCPSCHKMIPSGTAPTSGAEGPEGRRGDHGPGAAGFWGTLAIGFPSCGRRDRRSCGPQRQPRPARPAGGRGRPDRGSRAGVIDPIRLGELFKP